MTALPASASVVIPAHDEEAVIGRCLSRLLHGAKDGDFQVIVVCNACTDRTAEIARSFSDVEVLELETASKLAALDAGDAATDVFPRLYVDADIQLSTEVARRLARRLTEPGVEAAAPRPVFDVSGRSWAVRSYFRLYQRLPAFGYGYVGSGLFALSEAGRRRFGRWPEGLPDDGFVQRLIPHPQRVTVEGTFVVTTPRSLRAQTKRAVRVQGLNRALERDTKHHLSATTAPATLRFLLGEARSPANWPGILFVLAVAACARLRARFVHRPGRQVAWIRDDSSRQSP